MDELALRVAVKRELRKRMRGVRATMPEAAAERRSEAIRARLLALPAYEAARTVAFFWPIPGRHEVDLRPLLERAWRDGKQVALPTTIDDGAEISLRLLPVDTAPQPGPLGFDEPPPDAPLLTPVDLAFVPALAVDPSGHRIGYGRGYYDRLLSRREVLYSVAVAYDFQLLGEVPQTPGDWAVDAVVTDTQTMIAREPRREPDEPGPAAPGEPGERGVRVVPRPRRA